MLADHILEDIALRGGRPPREITPSALAVLSAYPWPGNLHELRSVLEQVALGAEEAQLTAEDFSLVLPRVSAAVRGSERATLRLADVVADAERSAIRSALAAADGKKVRAAELLGISRATLYQKLSELATARERSH
jgi:DNA-binding NtrC family response regulator